MWKTKLRAVPPLFLVANSLSWFILSLTIITQLASATTFDRILAVSVPYFGALILSAIIGSTLLSQKLREKKYLLLWNLMGVFSSLLFYVFISQANLSTIAVLSLVLGSSIGLGIPSCLRLFANQTRSEKRGRLGGVIFFLIQIVTALILLPLDGVGTKYQFLILAIWRLLGIGSILLLTNSEKFVEERKTSLLTVMKERKFILYFLPWFMFTLINFIETPIIEFHMGPQMYNISVLVTFVISSFSAIAGGILCDIKGRKTTGILGFVLLGIGYAFLSFLSDFSGQQLAQYIYMFFDGAAWGILYVTFIFVVWGDLSEGNNREKYYLLGGMPFLFSGLIEILVQPFAGTIPITAAFTLASFFLFIAILPLLYASESLSEKTMKDRELKTYLEKAQKFVKKETEKNRPKETKAKQEENAKSEENKEENQQETAKSSEYEQARKLAEKYY
jgi:MFS family permease